MTPEEILSHPARVLTEAQRERCFADGFASVKEIAPADALAELQQATAAFQEKSRAVTASDETYDIGPGRSADSPVLRRLKSPDIRHDAYWRLSTGLMADVAANGSTPPTP